MVRPPCWIEILLWPLAMTFKMVVHLRNYLYDLQVFKSEEVSVPVVSVGNLTVGGTGKTPLTAMLVERILKRGLRAGIVSRGYKSKATVASRVPVLRQGDQGLGDESPLGAVVDRSEGFDDEPTAHQFGDEPTWLANQFTTIPVYVGVKKVEVSRKLLQEEKVDLLLADDAFQHRKLKRKTDLIVIDATEPRWHYRPLPLGRMREGFEALARAHAIFLTKTNLVNPGQLVELRSWILRHSPKVGSEVPLFELKSVIASVCLLHDHEEASIAVLASKKILLVSGIGRPSTFATLIEEAVFGNVEPHTEKAGRILDHLVFSDHHEYDALDLKKIESKAVEIGADVILVTEKDAVKLAGWRSQFPVYVSRLKFQPCGNEGEFYEAIDRLLF